MLALPACGGSSSARNSSYAMEPPPAGAAGTLSSSDGTLVRDPVRDELREILTPCQRRLANLRGERVELDRRRTILTVIAQLLNTVYLSGYAGGQMRPTGGACAGGTLDPACGMTPESQFGHQFGGDDEDVVGPQALPERAIAGALEALDNVLWQTPNSADWTDDERTAYETRRNDLARLCEQLQRVE